MSDISKEAEEGSRKQMLLGIGAGAIAYLIWGLNVIYYKRLVHINIYEIVSHRTLWCTVFCGVLALLFGHGRAIMGHLHDRKTMLILFITGFLISSSWFLYLWLVVAGHVMQASLGQFIIPLGSVLSGILVLRERPPVMQMAGFGFATLGVIYFAISLGFVPWMGLYIPFSFVVYTLLRKMMQVDPLDGLFIEMALMTPFAVAFLIYRQANGGMDFINEGPGIALLLIGSGIVTAVPLILFVSSSKHVSMTTLGFMQYLVPSMTFLLAVFAYHEPLTHAHMVTFGLIWIGLTLFTADVWRRERALRRLVVDPVG